MIEGRVDPTSDSNSRQPAPELVPASHNQRTVILPVHFPKTLKTHNRRGAPLRLFKSHYPRRPQGVKDPQPKRATMPQDTPIHAHRTQNVRSGVPAKSALCSPSAPGAYTAHASSGLNAPLLAGPGRVPCMQMRE